MIRYLILCLFLLWPAAASGGVYVSNYKIESADKKYVFIMLRDKDSGYSSRYFNYPYPESGLYFNDGSTTPLWTVDWCAHAWLSSDGLHVIRRGELNDPHRGYAQEAFTIFNRGEPVKTFLVTDLVSFPFLLPHSMYEFEWQRPLSLQEGAIDQVIYIDSRSNRRLCPVAIDDKANTIRLATLQYDEYEIDLNTGRIVSESHPFQTTLLITGLLLVLIYLTYLILASGKPLPPLLRCIRRVSLKSLFTAWAVIFIVFTCLQINAYILHNLNLSTPLTDSILHCLILQRGISGRSSKSEMARLR